MLYYVCVFWCVLGVVLVLGVDWGLTGGVYWCVIVFVWKYWKYGKCHGIQLAIIVNGMSYYYGVWVVCIIIIAIVYYYLIVMFSCCFLGCFSIYQLVYIRWCSVGVFGVCLVVCWWGCVVYGVYNSYYIICGIWCVVWVCGKWLLFVVCVFVWCGGVWYWGWGAGGLVCFVCVYIVYIIICYYIGVCILLLLY